LYNVGNRVEVTDSRHEAYKRQGTVVNNRWGYLTVKLIDQKTGLETFARAPISYFEKTRT
jgi:hypothetical protein